ncbi:MAG: S9 family peptidase [Gemmatimonadetes bacterium]|nr:MAG: S9 family peptidase [Gemmatimonadota bacterium]
MTLSRRSSRILTTDEGLSDGRTVGRKGDMTTKLLVLLGCLTLPLSPFPFPVLSAQKRAMTVDDYLALKSVGDPQLSPDGKWVAYTVTENSLKDNRGIARIWLADVSSGQVRQLTAGPGSDRQPRWSPDGRTLAFVSTRESGAQLWVLPIAGGEARRVTSLADGVFDPLWLPDGTGLVVTSDIKWPARQEIDGRNGDFPTVARLWTGLLWRHWDDWRAGKRQHLFVVSLADGSGTAKDVTPGDYDVPTIATGGDGDVSVSPDGREIAVAMHGDSTVADNTNVDVYIMGRDGSGMRALSAGRGADNTPRYSPDGKWLAYLSMERPGFEADRLRLMLVGRSDGRTVGPSVEATKGWTLSVGSYIWCPDSKCLYAVVEERGRDNIYRIDLPSFHRSVAVGGGGVNTGVQVMPDGRGLVYLHQSNTQPNEVWASGRQVTHHNDAALEALDLRPLDEFGFVGALGDSVFGWVLKPPGFAPAKRYPLVYLIHGGPQGAWTDYWGARWNYALFASRGYVVAAVNFHGSTGYGQKFTDAISQHWGDYPYQDLMKGLDVAARLPYVDSTRMGAAGASYGGYMIYWIAGHTGRFRTLVSHDGVFNPVSMAGSTEELWFVDWEFGGTPSANRALYEKWSPLNAVQNWKTPILIVHSQLDYRVDLSEGYQAFTAAKRQGVPAKFLYFPDEGHWVLRPRNRRVWWGTVLDWIDQYLKPAPPPAGGGAR